MNETKSHTYRRSLCECLGVRGQPESAAILILLLSTVLWALHKPEWWKMWTHYNDVIMSVMASQIASLTIVYSTVYSRCRSKKTSKLSVTGLCEGNSLVTGEFPAQSASNAEYVSMWWRHRAVGEVWKLYTERNVCQWYNRYSANNTLVKNIQYYDGDIFSYNYTLGNIEFDEETYYIIEVIVISGNVGNFHRLLLHASNGNLGQGSRCLG